MLRYATLRYTLPYHTTYYLLIPHYLTAPINTQASRVVCRLDILLYWILVFKYSIHYLFHEVIHFLSRIFRTFHVTIKLLLVNSFVIISIIKSTLLSIIKLIL